MVFLFTIRRPVRILRIQSVPVPITPPAPALRRSGVTYCAIRPGRDLPSLFPAPDSLTPVSIQIDVCETLQTFAPGLFLPLAALCTLFRLQLTQHTRDSLTRSVQIPVLGYTGQPSEIHPRITESFSLCTRHCASHLSPLIRFSRHPPSSGLPDSVLLHLVVVLDFYPLSRSTLWLLRSFSLGTYQPAVDSSENCIASGSQEPPSRREFSRVDSLTARLLLPLHQESSLPSQRY